jgi:hypothetical protein
MFNGGTRIESQSFGPLQELNHINTALSTLRSSNERLILAQFSSQFRLREPCPLSLLDKERY